MAFLKVKTESHPKRCEVCHKNDLFDPANNKCTRCSVINLPDQGIETITKRTPYRPCNGSEGIVLTLYILPFLALVVRMVGACFDINKPFPLIWDILFPFLVYVPMACLLLKKIHDYEHRIVDSLPSAWPYIFLMAWAFVSGLSKIIQF